MEITKPGRERSPNYPAHSLREAVTYASQVYVKLKRNTVPIEMVSRALGYKGASGLARSKIAALRQYGLLDSSKAGYALTDLALPFVLKKPEDPDFQAAAKRAALTPELFGSLMRERSDMDDEALEYYLITEEHFSGDGAKKAIKAFRETMTFAKLGAGDYTQVSDSFADEKSPVTTANLPRSTVQTRGAPFARHYSAAEPGELILNVPGSFSLNVAFASGQPTRQGIAAVMQLLELVKNSYPAEAIVAPGSAEETPEE